MNTTGLRRSAFLLLLAGVTLAFLWVLLPFFGALMWAVTLALLFHPVHQRLLRRVRVGRAHEHQPARVRIHVRPVIGVAALAAQQRVVFLAQHGVAAAEAGGGGRRISGHEKTSRRCLGLHRRDYIGCGPAPECAPPETRANFDCGGGPPTDEGGTTACCFSRAAGLGAARLRRRG